MNFTSTLYNLQSRFLSTFITFYNCTFIFYLKSLQHYYTIDLFIYNHLNIFETIQKGLTLFTICFPKKLQY